MASLLVLDSDARTVRPSASYSVWCRTCPARCSSVDIEREPLNRRLGLLSLFEIVAGRGDLEDVRTRGEIAGQREPTHRSKRPPVLRRDQHLGRERGELLLAAPQRRYRLDRGTCVVDFIRVQQSRSWRMDTERVHRGHREPIAV